MKISITLSFLYLTFLTPLSAQWYDHSWLTGYNDGNNTTPGFGITYYDFSQNIVMLDSSELNHFDFYLTNVSFSDSLGNLLFYSNGIEIWNADHELMENGGGLNPGLMAENWENSGYPVVQGMLTIPAPGHPEEVWLLHSRREYPSDTLPAGHTNAFFLTKVNILENAGTGKVIEKNIPIILDTLDTGRLTACRHANGRDWWMVVNEDRSDSFYTLLISPEGVQVVGKQQIGENLVGFLNAGAGQAIFSPDGTKYAWYRLFNPETHFLYLFDFDRCTGQLSNFQKIFLPFDTCEGGAAFSPNSRFLYLPSCIYTYQLDMEAPNVAASIQIVAEWDGYVTTGTTRFRLAQLGPDGRIYIGSNGSVDKMHIIHHPNEPGADCNFAQRELHLPTINNRSIPNFPNYRLGPLDGSPCDTLGIDNLPLAHFSYADTALVVRFTDNSFYEPTDWLWTFGDGNSSDLPDPYHTYPEGGVYQVCLTVSNANGTDSFCRLVEVENPLGVQETPVHSSFLIFPNPAFDRVTIQARNPAKWNLSLVNSLGEVLYQTTFTQEHQFSTQSFAAGLYWIYVTDETGQKRDVQALMISR